MFEVAAAPDSLWAFPTIADIPPDIFRQSYDSIEARHKTKMRDAHKMGLPYKFPKKHTILKKVWFRHFGNNCLCCFKPMQAEVAESNSFATIDHVLARSLGGHSTDYANLTVICSKCNSGKSAYEFKIKMVLDGTTEEVEQQLAA